MLVLHMRARAHTHTHTHTSTHIHNGIHLWLCIETGSVCECVFGCVTRFWRARCVYVCVCVRWPCLALRELRTARAV